ncbi:MAG: TatD family hydrolase [Helicobacter sp.]|uniref:TatD family hydrolase n=1 Tax=Helicobacter sp. TaxID=218 RepID=UPI003750063F|nr:TatD family hydrolase [Helicobacter sp.]
MMIDTHCHLDSQAYNADLDRVIADALHAGIKQIVIPGAFGGDLPKAREIAHRYQHIYFAAGIHPCELDSFSEDLLREFVRDEKCVAIGECGLDYFQLPESGVKSYKNRQKELFIAQIELALEYKKPLIVHVREASNDAFEILKAYPELRGVLHCFNADRILLGLQNFYYGIGGVCTFKNARRLVEVLPLVPKDRLLLETDAPYLTPHPHRGERNEPKYIPLIAEKIAEILSLSHKEIQTLSTQNAYALFTQIPPILEEAI